MNAAVAVSQPVRLRPTTQTSIGTTAFFRNRALLDVVLGRIAQLPQTRIAVLVHACSIGAEVWSLLIAARLDPRTRDKHIDAVACDIAPEFVDYAQQAIYPRAVLTGMHREEQAHFEAYDAESVRVRDDVRRQASFLPAQSLVDFQADEAFDVVLVLNALLYLPAEQQARVIDRVAACNRALLVTTGFHFDQMRGDMQRNGYLPVSDRARAVHDGWSDRRRSGPARDEIIPGKIYHAWSLPDFSEIEDYEYKYCAVFQKGCRP
jgi:SAM-dependent methyltransferase